MVTSGIRIGTPAVTTRGMKDADMPAIADFINDAIGHKGDDKALKGIAEKVKGLCSRFPMYPGFEN